jgi:hypothetical protein
MESSNLLHHFFELSSYHHDHHQSRRPVNHHLLIVILLSIIDNVEEAELVNTLASGNHTKPISQLLLLEELLCPII